MAPEQVRGEEADARTDLFAFGAVFYEMLTGQRAFSAGSEPALIAAILEQDPPPLTSRQPLAPPALERLVTRVPGEGSGGTLAACAGPVAGSSRHRGRAHADGLGTTSMGARGSSVALASDSVPPIVAAARGLGPGGSLGGPVGLGGSARQPGDHAPARQSASGRSCSWTRRWRAASTTRARWRPEEPTQTT